MLMIAMPLSAGEAEKFPFRKPRRALEIQRSRGGESIFFEPGLDKPSRRAQNPPSVIDSESQFHLFRRPVPGKPCRSYGARRAAFGSRGVREGEAAMTGSVVPTEPDRKPATEDGMPRVPTVRSEQLLQGGREVRIVHSGQVYRLQVTRNNKLILQK
jgi:hemin uptake protein HemP